MKQIKNGVFTFVFYNIKINPTVSKLYSAMTMVLSVFAPYLLPEVNVTLINV